MKLGIKVKSCFKNSLSIGIVCDNFLVIYGNPLSQLLLFNFGMRHEPGIFLCRSRFHNNFMVTKKGRTVNLTQSKRQQF